LKITLVVAHDNNKAIGKDGDMPWHLPNDLKWFKKKTIHKMIVMGRATWESLPDQYKPLPNRVNLVMTKNQSFSVNGAVACHSLEEVLTIAKAKNVNELMIVGGGKIYELFYPLADQMVITEVNATIDHPDTFFVDYTEKDWYESFSESHQKDDKHVFDYKFRILKKSIIAE